MTDDRPRSWPVVLLASALAMALFLFIRTLGSGDWRFTALTGLLVVGMGVDLAMRLRGRYRKR